MEKNSDILSMKSGEALDVLGQMTPYIETIIADPEYVKLREKMKADENTTVRDIMLEAFTVIAVKNRKALYGIVSIATGKTVKEVEQQPIRETMSALEGVTRDEVLSFFTFFALMVAKL